jgi:hypothetical protein
MEFRGGEISGEGSVTGEISSWRLMMTCGGHMSERERGITGTGSGIG